MAQVNCAVMTNIGVTHIEQLGSQQNILEEKLHIQDNMAADGLLVLNGDDGLLRDVVPENGRRKILY
ncbi:Mur ligase family protein, partial [Eggerthella lenta]|uniref:Mur ligase family protein n=1 Tax=Eggerthella lenta TaxID=84112 RepID=UPI00352D7AEE